MCGGQADKEVINFAESFSTELQMWEPIASRMFHPRVGLGEFVKQHTNSNVLSMWGGGGSWLFCEQPDYSGLSHGIYLW